MNPKPYSIYLRGTCIQGLGFRDAPIQDRSVFPELSEGMRVPVDSRRGFEILNLSDYVFNAAAYIGVLLARVGSRVVPKVREQGP